MKGPKKVFVCSECDAQFPRWSGQCPSCRAWNTLSEETYTAPAKQSLASVRPERGERATTFSKMEDTDSVRIITGIGELDRVLGGGLVPGSAVLLAGEPGIGKSTLLMQLCGKADDNYTVLYVSGEESKGQLKMRAQRLGVDSADVLVLTETDLDSVINEYERVSPDVVIVDSVQTMVSASVDSFAGSPTQVRECSSSLITHAKADGCAIILVGHVTKEGNIAGPKTLEHMVDAVLNFEGDRSQSHRIVRAIKNRYGSTNEIGVFEMTDTGLWEVDNPSAMLLAGRPREVSGSCAVCVMEGTRPIIAEIQALVTTSVFPSPKRMADGIDYNRMCLLLAVLEKRLGYKFSQCDVYLNVVGGLRIDEPSADAAIATALISSLKDIPVPADLIVAGEIGLSGEVRAISAAEQRAKEAERIGFKRIALPKRSILKKQPVLNEAKIIGVSGIYDFAAILATGAKNTNEDNE
ncbi:MAG: DNA repair protein RadA [Clostridia bacterium]|nr:DNA repair protein RadA [Clostridia bacterium]